MIPASVTVDAPARGIRLAVIDRDEDFVSDLELRCRVHGWAMSRVGARTLDPQSVRAAKVNALLLDPAGMSADWWERLGPFCATAPDIAVVICTGPSSVSKRVQGLRLGAEDWVTKPCDLGELMARIERITQDCQAGTLFEPGVDLIDGEIELRPDARLIRVKGRIVNLSPREYGLLRLFMVKTGRPIDRDELFLRVWGYSRPWGDRSVDTYVLKLRNKLASWSPGWAYIHTHRRYGYCFEARPVRSALLPAAAAEGQGGRRPAVRPHAQ